MACIDLKDAYYPLPIRVNDRKYLKFQWNGKLFQFTCLPNGLFSEPRKFTKIFKPPLASLHTKGHIILGHLDDFYLQGKTYAECRISIIDMLHLFSKLGLLVHPEKSTFLPCQKLVTLGFEIDSVLMTVTLTRAKATVLKRECEAFIVKSSRKITIREVAQILGKLVSSFPGVLYGLLYYCYLKKDKCSALTSNNGNFDAKVRLSNQAISELTWWSHNVLN